MLRLIAFLVGEFILAVSFCLILVIAAFWWLSRDLPDIDYLKNYTPKTLTRIYAQDGSTIGEFAQERRLFVAIDEIPELVRNAFISAEDKNFYIHRGVDGIGIAKAMVRNIDNYRQNKRFHGASTITQQVMKNFLLSNERSIERKFKEALLALRMEQSMSKERILEIYLNEIFLGSRSYGIASAAENYFNKQLKELEPEEAAYLAALPKSPSRLHPIRNHSRAIDRRNYVLKEMYENNYINKQMFKEAVARPLITRLNAINKGKKDEDTEQTVELDYYSEEVRRYLVAKFGRKAVYQEGLSVRTPMDPTLQNIARRTLRTALEKHDRLNGYAGPFSKLSAEDLRSEKRWRKKLSEIDRPKDIAGWKLAVVLSPGKNDAKIGIEGVKKPQILPFSDVKSWARKRDKDGNLGPKLRRPSDIWQAGDVIFVAFIKGEDGGKGHWSMRQLPTTQGALMAMDAHSGKILAMQGGFSYQQSSFNRATQAGRQPGSAFKPFVYGAALENGYNPTYAVADRPITIAQGPNLPDWRPRNYSDKFYGCSPLRLGLELSRNLMTVRIADLVGIDKVAEFAERFGVYDKMPLHMSYSLGAGETTLLRLMGAYATFANGGYKVEPSFIGRVQDRAGRTLERNDAKYCIDCSNVEWSDAEYSNPQVYLRNERIIDPIPAFQMVSMLQGVTIRGTANKLRRLKFQTAGKTGTSNDSKDAWFIGFTPEMVVGCFIGYDRPSSLGEKASGGALCGPVFEQFMREAIKDNISQGFTPPAGSVMVKVNRWTGARLEDDAGGANVVDEILAPYQVSEVGQYGGGTCQQLDFGEQEEEIEPNRPAVGLGTGGLY